MKYHKMQQSKLSLSVTATDATYATYIHAHYVFFIIAPFYFCRTALLLGFDKGRLTDSETLLRNRIRLTFRLRGE